MAGVCVGSIGKSFGAKAGCGSLGFVIGRLHRAWTLQVAFPRCCCAFGLWDFGVRLMVRGVVLLLRGR